MRRALTEKIRNGAKAGAVKLVEEVSLVLI
jgi:hypothetical protein